jgi:hypothetical protein
MFNNEFTFGSSTSLGENGSPQTVTDIQIEQLKQETRKNKNIIYKKNITIKFYKSFVIMKKGIGLGDIVDFFTKYTGLKWLIIKLTKGNCGCEKRRILFNKWLTIPILYATIKEQTFEQTYYINDPVDFYKIKDNKKDKKINYSALNNLNGPKKPSCGCGRKQ